MGPFGIFRGFGRTAAKRRLPSRKSPSSVPSTRPLTILLGMKSLGTLEFRILVLVVSLFAYGGSASAQAVTGSPPTLQESVSAAAWDLDAAIERYLASYADPAVRGPAPSVRPAHARPAVIPVDSLTAVVNQYCVRCHNERRMRGNLTLTGFDVASAPAICTMEVHRLLFGVAADLEEALLAVDEEASTAAAHRALTDATQAACVWARQLGLLEARGL